MLTDGIVDLARSLRIRLERIERHLNDTTPMEFEEYAHLCGQKEACLEVSGDLVRMMKRLDVKIQEALKREGIME